jgi:hypothetical protein
MNKAKKLARQLQLKAQTRTWRDIAEQDYDGRIHFSVLNRIAKTNGAYIPADHATQYLLGLYRPRRMTPKTIVNDDRGQSWTHHMRHLIKSIRTDTPKELSRRKS